MKKALALAALLALAAPAQATDWLKGDSYACTSEWRFDQFMKAMDLRDNRKLDQLLTKGCYLIGSPAKADVLEWHEDSDKAYIRAYQGGNSVLLWTRTYNVQRNE